jgi:predicted nucleotide-binding protein
MVTKLKKPERSAQSEIAPEKAIELLKRQIASGEQLLDNRPINEDAYSTWSLLTHNYLAKAFGANSPNVTSVFNVDMYGSFPLGASDAWWENHRTEMLHSQLSKMKALVELLSTEIELQRPKVAPVHVTKHRYGHKIFLVHGHDELALQETARFLEKLGQDLVILREQPHRGRTIIEKFEDYASVGFAVVLLTADDRGGSASDPVAIQQPRARQNVIFELGYFIGRLGKNRVCALYRPGVEIPSDYSGVLYQELDEKGGWRLQLAKELKAAGLNVDMNKAL